MDQTPGKQADKKEITSTICWICLMKLVYIITLNIYSAEYWFKLNVLMLSPFTYSWASDNLPSCPNQSKVFTQYNVNLINSLNDDWYWNLFAACNTENNTLNIKQYIP